MQAVDPKPDFLGLEKKILDHWQESDAFATLKAISADRPPFRFIDGPITANNPMGVHHAWGRTLKDVFIRYKLMNGYSCRHQNGFDCQGLWVEVEVEKELGFESKADIERFGLDAFSRACRERVNTFAKVISEQSQRLGQWMDWDHSYYTHDDSNITGIWHFLHRCHENGWLYEGSLPLPWCPRCGTGLSEHEMAGSYQEMTHLSVYAQVPLADDPSRRFLVWTTTPWTLAANVALAVNPKLQYCEVSAPEWDHTLILGAETLGRLAGFEIHVERRFPGSELIGKRYETFFPDLPAQADIEHRVVPWSEVDAEEGAGIVHIAPGCGREDYELGQELGLPVIVPVDDSGVYESGFDWLTGRVAMQVGKDVANALDEAGKLLKAEDYHHSFPICWRCKGEVIFRLVGEWFIRSEEVRPRMVEAAKTVDWEPDFIGKRMENWLHNMGDWCISRKRYWGLPLPFYPCKACGTLNVVGSREELRERALDPAAVDALPELHRPWIDAIEIRCSACGEATKRVTEVGDCWLDAGIVPYTTQGYFEDRAAWEKLFPAAWISEMREQVRLWYYSMLFMGVTISGRAPYEKVLSYERVVAEDGTKFSKTGHMIRFDEAVGKIGADAVRYLFCRQPVANECRFGYSQGEIAQRRLTSLWNLYTFFVTYARLDAPEVGDGVPTEGLRITDRWLLARTAHMLDIATTSYEAYDTAPVLREIEEYLDEVSNWYVRVSRRRFWRAGHAADKQAAYAVLYEALRTVVTVLAPITPFITESIWQNLMRSLEPEAPASVHHAAWPASLERWRDEALLDHTCTVRTAISLALRLREQARQRVRQPLPVLHVIADAEQAAALEEQAELIRSELNVKEIAFASDLGAFEVERLALDFKAAGPTLRKDAGRVSNVLKALGAADMAKLVAALDAGEPLTVPGVDQSLEAGWLRREQAIREGFQVGSEGELTLVLDTQIDDALYCEGLMRDLVRKIQVLRRASELELTQRIELVVETDDEEMKAVIATHRTVIVDEVLATSLTSGVVEEDGVMEEGAECDTFTARWKIQGHPVAVSLRLVAAPA